MAIRGNGIRLESQLKNIFNIYNPNMSAPSNVQIDTNFKAYFAELCKNNSMYHVEMSLITSKHKLFRDRILQALPSVQSTGRLQVSDLDSLSKKIWDSLTSNSDSELKVDVMALHKELF